MAADLAALPPDIAALIAERTRGWPPERKAALAAAIRQRAALASPGALAQALDSRTRQTAALRKIDQALVDVDEGRCKRLMISIGPQEGKSLRTARYGSLWALARNPDRRVAITSYADTLASGHGAWIRDQIDVHGSLLDLHVKRGSSSKHEWELDGHAGSVVSVGLRGGLTGKPVDWMVIDDPFADRQEADSVTARNRVWGWWTDVALARGPKVVILIGTRWHEDDLHGRLLEEDAALPLERRQWRVLNIPIVCEDPATDPLGREVGEYLESARDGSDGGEIHDLEFYEIRQRNARTWAALYQGHPTPAEGGIFQWDWIRPFRARPGDLPVLAKTVVAVDTTGGGHDEAGIVTAARGVDRRTYVLADRSARHTLGGQWRAAWLACLDDDADALVYEGNFVDTAMRKAIPQAWRRIVQQARALDAEGAVALDGEELEQALARVADRLAPRLADADAYEDDQAPDQLVEQLRALLPYVQRVLRSPEQGPCPVVRVWASKGKRTRAEPTAQAYETGQVSHGGVFPALEQEMVTWQEGQDSPNRVDALVWAWTALNTVGGPVRASAPTGSIQTGPSGLVRR